MKKLIVIYCIFVYNIVFAASIDEKVFEVYKKGNYTEAILKIDEELKVEPSNYYLNILKANSLYNIGSNSGALNCYKKAIDKTNIQEKALIYYNIGVTLTKQGDFSSAIEYYKKSIKNSPNNENAKYNLSYCLLKLKSNSGQSKEKQNNGNTKSKPEKIEVKKISKETGKKMLEMIENIDQNIQTKIKRNKTSNVYNDKRW